MCGDRMESTEARKQVFTKARDDGQKRGVAPCPGEGALQCDMPCTVKRRHCGAVNTKELDEVTQRGTGFASSLPSIAPIALTIPSRHVTYHR